MKINKKDLIDFENKVVTEFKKGETYGPVHLSGGNEEPLLKIFKKVKPQDWVFSTHRSHYHALLKSKDPKWLMNEIIVNANSSHINSKKHKIFTSSIVGGIIPIALGVAMGIKMKQAQMEKDLKEIIKPMKGKDWKVVGKVKVFPKNLPHVWCFIGDMAVEMGCFAEADKYAINFNLPITFVVEDNALGCDTPTNIVWGEKEYPNKKIFNVRKDIKTIYYNYKRFYPHYGIGEWIIFAKDKKMRTKGDYVAEKIK